MTDFEKVSGGTAFPVKPDRYVFRYRNKAGDEHVMDIIEKAQNNTDSIRRLKTIKDFLDKNGCSIIDDELTSSVSGGAAVPVSIDDRHFDSIWKRDPRKVIKVFKNAAGSINLEEMSVADRASVIRDIVESMSVPGKERLLIAGILLSDDDLDVAELVRERRRK